MIFPTLNFLLFFLVVCPIAWALAISRAHTLHKLSIIAASYFFYAFWNWRLAFLLFSSVVLNFVAGRLIDRTRGTPWCKRVVSIAVILNLSLLGFFKYYGWFLESLDALLRSLDMERELPFLEIVLPIGISFFTFQGISYIVDLYRGDLDRSRPLIDVMFFISFFPHLVAGPIVRAAAFLPQLERPPNPNRVFVGLGLILIIWGVFKKAIVANYLAVSLVDKAFFDPTAFGAVDLLFAVYAYAVQIYCDFSAYSDIAIGIAALLGYRFQRNFNQPYRAETLADFWRRWHMSLSSWLRDYLYIPLGGNRGGELKTYRNLLLTMVLGGIWHGAAWKFVIWRAAWRLPRRRARHGLRARCRQQAAVAPRARCAADLPLRVLLLDFLPRRESGARRRDAGGPGRLVAALATADALPAGADRLRPRHPVHASGHAAAHRPPLPPPAWLGGGRADRRDPAGDRGDRRRRRSAVHLLPVLRKRRR